MLLDVLENGGFSNVKQFRTENLSSDRLQMKNFHPSNESFTDCRESTFLIHTVCIASDRKAGSSSFAQKIQLFKTVLRTKLPAKFSVNL